MSPRDDAGDLWGLLLFYFLVILVIISAHH